MDGIPTETRVRNLLIAPREIHFLRFILEAYPGIAVVSTIDPQLGLVRLNIAPGCEEEVDAVLEAEKERLQLRSVRSL
ncbi:MAG TPA: DUF4911 domain-containing protein [Syntrophobacteraceae bacterium]|nr:DUF4911 domain-containing protein [Syntrophobacteraceae bacterium]